jgi:hypothetical protein
MEMSKNKFTRLKKKVLDRYPSARIKVNNGGKFYVSDGTGNKLESEYMIPPQKTIKMAWYWLSQIIKTNQNIQRTHPNRMDLNVFERKFNRIANRNRKK